MSLPPLLIVGTGGHARECIEASEAAGRKVCGLLDHDQARWDGAILGIPVLRGEPETHDPDGTEWIIAVGDNAARSRIVATLGGRTFATLIHPFSWISPSADIAPGCMIFAGCVVQTGVHLGRHSIINTGATVSHDCGIGDVSHVAVGAHLAGNVTLGARVLFGAGAVARPGVTIGDDATVGAGAAVVSDVAAGARVVGTPAR
ncbi:MAG: acetyltransferase [Minwuia sp.]|nr:acetyltransferase [Minwuia sp.]